MRAIDTSSGHMCQQQGVWCAHPERQAKAKKWQRAAGVLSADAFIAIGKEAGQPEVVTAIQTRAASGYTGTPDFDTADYPASDANVVADKCKQIGAMRANRGADQSEPEWFNSLGILLFCTDGKQVAHDWSCGHKGYSQSATDAKVAYRSKFPPTTCDHFRVTNPDGCAGCKEQCRSPITLGWVNVFEVDDLKLRPATETIRENLPKIKADSAVVLEDQVINALAEIKKAKPADYNRQRADLKRLNSKVPLMDMDRAVKARIAEADSAQTHHGYAKSVLAELVEKSFDPVGLNGLLYVLNPDTNLWEGLTSDALIKMVAERHDSKDFCTRRGDYRAIAEHAVSLASDDAFFADIPNGLACPGGFYQIVGNEIRVVPLLPEHRQRVMLGFNPVKMATPLFDNFLHETFQSESPGEKSQQVTLLQEIAGAIMLGILHKYQFAVLFYEPFGRAGKGTLERQLRALVPKEFISAISPFNWHREYHLATLAGKRLNVVGELPENEPIPASAFKSVIGGDYITGRHPTHRPITFTNEAAHLFTSNHLITTKDQSEAFFVRWKIVEFPNSRLRSGLPLDPGLAERILGNELPGIGYWALEGAARLLRNGKFSPSIVHDRLMAKWRRSTNTLDEFIHECCVLSPNGTYKRAELYKDYVEWCSDNGRKPFAKGRVRDLLEHNIGLGVRLVEINGYETFRGLQEKPAKGAVTDSPSKSPVGGIDPLDAYIADLDDAF